MKTYNEDGFNVYLADGVSVPENTEFKQGVDVGNNSWNVTFKNGGKVDVIIRTNGGTLEIDASQATVKHYGEANNVNIENVAGESYHEFGKVIGTLDIKSGHAVIEAGATVIHVNAAEGTTVKVESKENAPIITGDGTVAGADKASDDEVGTVNTADALIAAVANAKVKYIVLGDDIELSSPLNITRDMIIDGNGHKLSTSNTDSSARTINIGYDGAKMYDNISVTLCNITVAGPATASGGRGVNIGGEDNSVNIFNSTVTCGYYAINVVTADTARLKMKVDNSTITGWSVLSIWSNGHVIEVTNSTLTGLNDKPHSDTTNNDFGTICFEADATGRTNEFGYANSVKVVNCTVNVQSTSGNQQQLVAFNPGKTGSLGCKAEFINCKINYQNENCVPVYNGGSNNVLIINGKVEAQN